MHMHMAKAVRMPLRNSLPQHRPVSKRTISCIGSGRARCFDPACGETELQPTRRVNKPCSALRRYRAAAHKKNEQSLQCMQWSLLVCQINTTYHVEQKGPS